MGSVRTARTGGGRVMSDQKALAHLRDGDLIAFAENLEADERVEYDPTGAEGRGIHIRAGLADILIKPEGKHKVTGEVIYAMTAHGHGSMSDAVECYRSNVEKNLRFDREWLIDPGRATARAQARSTGMPEELINRLIPMPEIDHDEVIQTFRGQLAEMPEAPVSGGPPGWWKG